MRNKFDGHNVNGRSFGCARTKEAAHCHQVLELHNTNQFSSLRCLRCGMLHTHRANLHDICIRARDERRRLKDEVMKDVLYIVSPTHRPNNVCLP